MDGVEHGGATPTGIRQPDREAAGGTGRPPDRGLPHPGLGAGRSLAAPPAAMVARMVQAGITLEAMRAAVRRAHHADVRLVAGSDAGIAPLKPHGVLPETLVALVEADVPATEALAADLQGGSASGRKCARSPAGRL